MVACKTFLNRGSYRRCLGDDPVWPGARRCGAVHLGRSAAQSWRFGSTESASCFSRSQNGGSARLSRRVTHRVTCSAEQVQLLRSGPKLDSSATEARKLLVYFPGMDGTGTAVKPQIKGLNAAGFDVWSLYIDRADRSSWEELTNRALNLLRSLLKDIPGQTQVTLLAESFGGCLALRCAARAPELFERMVLVNPATCFSTSYGGLLNLIAATNLLSVFPEQLFQVAQAVLLPLLVDRNRVGDVGMVAVQQMMTMQPPASREEVEAAPAATDSGSPSRRGAFIELESYDPSAAGGWRLSLLQRGNLPDDILTNISVPVLLVSSARDRLLDSLKEGARLQRILPRAVRVVLPSSGHTALLEDGVDLARLMRDVGFLPVKMRTLSDPAATVSAVSPPGSSPTDSQGPGEAPKAPRVAANTQPVDLEGISSNAGWKTHETTGDVASPARDGSAVIPPETPGRTLKEAPPAAPPRSRRSSGRGAESLPPTSPGQRAKWGEADPAAERLTALYSPLRDIVAPVVRGAENLPSALETNRPLLLVGNHARVGLYDMPFLIIELYLRNIKVRGLAHPGHWRGPLGAVFSSFGAVKASPLAAYKLLKAGEAVLLFPGGGREVNKRRGEEYQLFWSAEPDFVRMAGKLNALILPFAAVGGDEAFELALDSSEVLSNPVLGGLTRAAFGRLVPELDLAEAVPPLTRLPGTPLPSPLPVPNLSRLYFRFMEPIDPGMAEGVVTDPEITRQVYAEVKASVYRGINMLREEQKTDPKNGLPARLLEQLSGTFPALDLLKF